MKPVVAYLSGHGFGHFTRSSAVLSLLPSVEVHVRTSARALPLARRASWATRVDEVDVGPGMAQRGPLETDLDRTRELVLAHLENWAGVVAEEAAFVKQVGARLIFADVPPIAFAIAARAGVPSVGMGNFSWSWIYRHAAESAGDRVLERAADELARAEGQATHFLALAMGGGLEVFPRQQAIAPVARMPRSSRDQVRAKLGLTKKTILVTFGGFGGDLDLLEVVRDVRRALPDFDLLIVADEDRMIDDSTRLIRPTAQLDHHELIIGSDVVVGKLGYGTVAECLRQTTPIAYVRRGEFAEEAPLEAAVARHLPSALMSAEELHSGNWSRAVHAAMAGRVRESLSPNGADQAAAAIVDLIR